MSAETSDKTSSDLTGARELENHLRWLDTFTPASLGVLSTASGIYTYLGISTLLDDTGSLSIVAALAYSTAVSVGIFVFWSYLLRLLPSMRSAKGVFGLTIAMSIGSLAIVAMSSWLNATALAGSAAVEQHLGKTISAYQNALEQANKIAVSAQGLEAEVERSAVTFRNLAEQESRGNLSGKAGEGTVYAVLLQKADELGALKISITEKSPLIDELFETGNKTITKMQSLKSGSGPIDVRSLKFSEESISLSGVITELRQISAAPLVYRAAGDLDKVILPALDGRTANFRDVQEGTIQSIMESIKSRADTLKSAAQEVMDLPEPQSSPYTSISSADAVILYASHFYPQWAGAIAIDLLPAILVFMLAITQAAIRNGTDGASAEERMTVSELRVAMKAIKDVEQELDNNKIKSK